MTNSYANGYPCWADLSSADLEGAKKFYSDLFGWTYGETQEQLGGYTRVYKDGKTVDEATVLATVPMWFGLLDEEKAGAMITQLSDADHQTDWGMRIISNASAKFSGGGYHYGSVWPLFTGWASVGEYRYHHEHAAYANLRANALLALDGMLSFLLALVAFAPSRHARWCTTGHHPGPGAGA